MKCPGVMPTVVTVLVLMALVREGECRECYSCGNCHTVTGFTVTKSCPASCLTLVTCIDGKAPLVDRSCSLTNEPTACTRVSSVSSSVETCYCNTDRCDPLAGVAEDQLCDAALPTSSFASLALTFAAFACALLLK